MNRFRKNMCIAVCICVLSVISWGAFGASLTPAPEGTFTIVQIPDTQRYLGPGSNREEESSEHCNPAFESRTTWLAANLEAQRVVFVTHTGDIVDINVPWQWEIARENMDRLHGHIPYGFSVGNHDMVREPGDSSLFQKYFGKERYSDFPWYGGAYEGRAGHAPEVSGNNANSYQLFSAGGLDFIIVHLECNAPDDVLAWAGKVLEDHRNRMAIIATHMYLGGIKKKGADQTQGRMQWKKVHGERGNTPQQLWEKSFCKYPNLFLIVCGDQSASITHHQTSKGTNGNTVYEVLTDYPRVADNFDWLRLFRFHPTEGRIEVFTYSPTQDCLCEGIGHVMAWEDHQFELDISAAIADYHDQK